jgi:hypothetical protein
LKYRATKKVKQHVFSLLFLFLLDPESGMKKKKIRIRAEKKIRIRDKKKSGSGMNIPDLQHW